VIRGLEDGDVRLIENAVGNLNIMEWDVLYLSRSTFYI
jgi:hypothetical protein